MKKIILFALTIITALTMLMDTHAYVSQEPVDYIVLTSYGSFVRPGGLSEYEEHELIYYSTSILGYNTNNLAELYEYSQLNEIDIIVMIAPLNEIVGHTILRNGVYIQTPVVKYAYLVIEYINDGILIYKQTNELVYAFQLNSQQEVIIEYTIQVYDYAGRTEAYNQGYNQGYANGQNDGYTTGRNEYGKYVNGQYISADNYGQIVSDNVFESTRAQYGYQAGSTWLTASEYGDLRYDVGYNAGLSNEIDWFSWSMTFFLMPFRIMNIQVLPGVRIGYFALFSLLLGVVGWFFFIVGKGGGRRK